MKKLKIYLDNCCFNRPYDNQKDIKIKIETEAKLIIQEKIKKKELDFAWSYILEYENNNNPFEERKSESKLWKDLAQSTIIENKKILELMNETVKKGLQPLDSLHIACAIELGCDYFVTVDRGIIKKTVLIKQIKIINPIDLIYILED